MRKSVELNNDSTMALLRTATWDLHQSVEGHGFQKALVEGSLSRDQYTRFMGQMLLIHTALEKHLRANTDQWPFNQIMSDRLYREELLLADLDCFGVDGRNTAPENATASLIAEIDRLGNTNPLALLGMLYVLEGSTNGGKWIAKTARKVYELESLTGAAYFDPYGDQQRENWKAFKEKMDGLDLSKAQRDAMVSAAKTMFKMMGEVSDDLVREPTTVSDRFEQPTAAAPRCPFSGGQN